MIIIPTRPNPGGIFSSRWGVRCVFFLQIMASEGWVPSF